MADGGADGLLVGAVGLDGDDAATGGLDGLDHFKGATGGGDVGQGDGGAVLCQAPGNGGADAAGTALDECDFAFEGFLSAHL
ncbi:hypothetical protein D3C85_1211850 [compost metagenome]